ncbi:MAG: NTP transferase domain-containing protein [Bacteroidetes bacterium]|nr:NTP transferase domain-containing protein [Bacteroidota bacterium]
MVQKNKYAVIMAGGVGSRFWPVSTKQKPKQFIDILGTGKSLIRQTYERFRKILPSENIYIVTNTQYVDLVREHIPEMELEQIVAEPFGKNTAPCIAYASYRIAKIDPDAVCVVAPSDHLILNEDAFLEICEGGMDFCSEHDALLCIGIKPHRPDTGYGYIQQREEPVTDNIHKVKTFTEKPSLELAQTFLDSGDFLWNAGIFIWNLESILSAFETHLPEMNQLFVNAANTLGTNKETETIASAYQMCTNISIDYGVLEKADNAFVYPGDFGWSDLGTWSSLYDVHKKDNNENAINGKLVNAIDSRGNMIAVPDSKLVVVNGVENLIIVESEKVLLVCDRSREQEVKQIVTDIKLKYGEKFL